MDASLFPPPPTAAPGTEWGAEPVEEEDADRAAFQAELERVAAEVRCHGNAEAHVENTVQL